MLFLINHIFSYEILICLTIILFCCESAQKVDFKTAVDATAKLIKLQMKPVFSLTYVSHNFNDVGLNIFENEDENNTFRIVSRENRRINKSAHYVFNMWPNTSKEELFSFAEKIRGIVEKIRIKNLDLEDITFTISVGATILLKNDNLESLIKRADKAMYEAKNSGRNVLSL